MAYRSFLILLVLFGLSETSYAIRPPRTGEIPEHLRPFFKEIERGYGEGYWAQQMQVRAAVRAVEKMNNVSQALKVDTAYVPVLLGRYSDAVTHYTVQDFQALLFDGPNSTGTVTKYYLENSYNQFYMTGKALGWFSLPRTFTYYVKDASGTGLSNGGKDFVIDLVVAADSSVDYSKFVKYEDSEGWHVPQLGVVHTGADAAAGASNIWSHRSSIRSRLLTRKSDPNETIITDKSRILSTGHYRTNDSLNGKAVVIDGDYALQPEMLGNSNLSGSLVEIGVFAHEFGHVFGLPDLYDRDNTSEGIGGWCLMASGSYGGDQRHEHTPSHMSAWCKEKLGWVTPIVINTFSLKQPIRYVEKYPEIYKLYVRNTTGGQYFLVENRQKTGFDTYLTNSGLLIYHVDPAVTSQNDNENHPLVGLEQADGRNDLAKAGNRGDNGDPYPGISDNRNFDGYTVPDSRDYLLAQTYVGVHSISGSDTVMKADLDVGGRPYLAIDKALLVESASGNSNGRADAGETGDLSLTVTNIYPTALMNGIVKISTPSSDVTIDTSARSLSLNGLATQDQKFSGVFKIKNGAVPKTFSFTVSVQSPEQLFTANFEAVIGYPSLVLVNLDTNVVENITQYFLNTVNSYGHPYEKIQTITNTTSNINLGKRDFAIWYTGRKTVQTIPDTLADTLASFVNRGGKLFLTGQNIAEDLASKNSPLRQSVLHADWKQNVILGRNLFGIPEDAIGAQLPKMVAAGGNGPSNQTSPDILIVDSTAHPMLLWNNAASTNYAGLWWENKTTGAKVVCWGFGFEAINDSSAGANTKLQAMTAVLNWFRGITATPEIAVSSLMPRETKFYDNYPNPFNPTTTIRFSLTNEENVSLKIYDVLGREVTSLVHRRMSPGEYTYTFDASALSSGVYLCRLEYGNFQAAKKMLFQK